MHWTNLTKDPNSLEIIGQRKKAVKASKAEPISERFSYIQNLAKDKNVLDVGIVDHLIAQHKGSNWLHGAIVKVAKKTLGVDILPEAVEALQKEGYNAKLLDITSGTVDEKFDLIVVGEVVEHLGNLGGLFENASKMLAPGGRLLLTTPNPYYIARVRDNLKDGFGWDSVDHVNLIFPFGVSELCERAGMRLDKWRGIKVQPPKSKKAKAIISALKILPLSPESLCDAMVYECVLQ